MIIFLNSGVYFSQTWRRPSVARGGDLVENRLRDVCLEEVGRWKRVARIFRLQSAGVELKKDLEEFLEAFICEIFMIYRRLMEVWDGKVSRKKVGSMAS